MVRSIKLRPITSLTLFNVGLYCLWQSYVITFYTRHLPAQRLIGYHGPLQMASLAHWAIAYGIIGVLMITRPFLLNLPKVDLALHAICMFPIMTWAVAFDVGPASTAQPAYTLVALLLAGTPLITILVDKAHKERQREAAGSQ